MQDLNKEQKIAASHGDGPMLVLAGPGAGKTKTLVARYAALVGAGVPPAAVLPITFTRAAAQQLKDRIAAELDVDEGRLVAGTFHAFCLSLMKRFPNRFGRFASRRLVDEGGQAAIARGLAPAWNEADGDAMTAIQRLKDNLVGVADQAERARRAPPAKIDAETRVAEIYAAYEAHLERHGLMDFGDLILAAVSAFESDPSFARAVSERFRHVMVDEYQDINAAQDRLLDCLLAAHRNLWVVGDDDQAIYGFRGSNVSFILNFQRKYADAKVVRLTENYRSAGIIVKAANGLVANNRRRLGKTLWTPAAAGEPILIQAAATPEAEAEWIARAVRAISRRGVPYSEIAVLCRVGHGLTQIERTLERSFIPVDISGAARFWQLPEIRLALRAIQKMTGQPLTDDPEPTPHWLERQIRDNQRGGKFLAIGMATVGVLSRRPPVRAGRDRQAEFAFSMGQLKEELQANPSADALRARIAQSADRVSGKGAVQLATIHAAKGLEWEAVFLAGCESGIMPHKLCEDEEEERRLAFVAVTRPRRLLALTYASERGGGRAGASKFIGEILRSLGEGEAAVNAAGDVVLASSNSDGPHAPRDGWRQPRSRSTYAE